MIIDFHTHVFPDKIASRTIEKLEEVSSLDAYTDGTFQSLLAEMKESLVDISVILPVVTKPEQFNTINATSVKINEGYREIVLSFGGIHPDSPDPKEQLRQIKKMGLRGIKLHPDYQNTYIDDIKYLRIIDYASELGLITVVHAGIDPGYPEPVHCTPKRAKHMITQVHPEKLVLAHMGGNGLYDEVMAELIGENVWFDTAFSYERLGEERFMSIVNAHGIDKILFATDSPWCSQKESIQWIKNLPLSKEEQDMIFSGNAKRLLKMN